MFSYLLIWKINKKEKYNILQGIQYDSSLLLHWLVYIIPNPIKSLEINKIFVLTDAMYVAYPVFWFQLNMYICLLLQTSLTFSVYMDYMLFLWIFVRIWNKKDGLYGKEIIIRKCQETVLRIYGWNFVFCLECNMYIPCLKNSLFALEFDNQSFQKLLYSILPWKMLQNFRNYRKISTTWPSLIFLNKSSIITQK